MCERYIYQLPLARPLLGTWPTTQACALTRNQTGDLLVCSLALNPLSYTSQGICPFLFCLKFFLMYLLIMLLQLSHFPPFTPLHPAHPLPPTFPPYSSCPWVILISSLASTFPTLFLPSPCLFSTYHLCYLFSVPFHPLSPSHSPIDNPPYDLHFCGSVSVLVVCLVFFCFGFRCGR